MKLIPHLLTLTFALTSVHAQAQSSPSGSDAGHVESRGTDARQTRGDNVAMELRGFLRQCERQHKKDPDTCRGEMMQKCAGRLTAEQCSLIK